MTSLAGGHAAGLLAGLHARAMPDAAWDEAAFARLLGLPGVFAFAGEGGFVLARSAADEAEILMLAVLAKARRRGLGRQLLRSAAAEARRRGARRLFLEVAEANLPAVGLYRAEGFAEAGRRRRYYADGADALVLALNLPACGT